MSKPKPPYAVVDLTPEEVRDETLLPARGTTCYWLALPDEEVELLAHGLVSEAVSRRAFAMLEWKRREGRMQARARPRPVPDEDHV